MEGGEEEVRAAEAALRPVPQPTASDYRPDRDRERVRGGLALGLFGLLALILLLLVWAVIAGWRSWDQLEGVATAVLGPVIGLTGTMLGFYFGQKER